MKTIRVAASSLSLALLLCVSAGCGTSETASTSPDSVASARGTDSTPANTGGTVQELSSCTGDNGSSCTCPSGQTCIATGGGCCCGCKVNEEAQAMAQKELNLPPSNNGQAARVVTRAPSASPSQGEQLAASCTGDNGSTCNCPAGQACIATGDGCCCGCSVQQD